MLNKVLIAIDESTASDWAFDTALAMAKPLGAELLLAHILDVSAFDSPKPPIALVDGFSQAADSPAQQKYEQQWQQFEERYNTLLEQKRAEAEAEGVSATHVQARGTAARQICELARINNVDLIVVGNRDRTNKSSISSYLVHHAPCSVTVVHPKTAQSSDSNVSRAEVVTV